MVPQLSPISSAVTASPGASVVKAILYTKFEDIEGYVVCASSPPKVMTDQFKDIGYQFLPDKGLCWRCISLTLGDYRMIGVPVHIEDSRYPRRALVFCFCVLVDNSSHGVRTGKILAQILADVFYHIETDVEHHLLSSSNCNGGVLEDSAKQSFNMCSFLDTLRAECGNTAKDHVFVHAVGDYYIQFKKPVIASAVNNSLNVHLGDAQNQLKPWYLVVPLVDASKLGGHFNHSFLIQVVAACDGVTCTGALAESLRLTLDELGNAVSLLKASGMVHVINQPVDQHTRVRLTPKFHSYFDALNNRQEALAYCTLDAVSQGNFGDSPLLENHSTTSISNLGDLLVRMYCKIDGHTSNVGDLESHLKGSHFSAKHMVVYGLIKGFLRTKTMFPYFNGSDTTLVPILRDCDGKSCWDAIAYKHRLTREQVAEQISHHHVLQIWK